MTEQNLDNPQESLNPEVASVDLGTQDVETQEQVPENTQDGDVVTLSREEFEALAKKDELAKNYKIRAEKVEEQLKEKKVKDKGDSGLSREEGKLYSKVYGSDLPDELADDALERVNKIAQLDNVSLDDAYKSEDFKIWKKTRVQEMKDKKAQLGASRGSRPAATKTLKSEGLSEAEHKALWAEKYR